MLSPQPVQLAKYVGSKRNIISDYLKRLFYLSYEDALWDLLIKKKIRKGSSFLIPDFFCTDVEKNIKNHGYKTFYYHINSDLSADTWDFEEKIKKYKPEIIIIFHPVGITSNLITNREWIKSLPDETIIIEDCVHRLIDPQKIEIYKKNHFLINSLRKGVPLQGSSIYGRKDDLNFNPPPLYQSFFYSLKVHNLWFLMNFCWSTGLFKIAEKLMKDGYDLIGDSILPARGYRAFKILEEYLDYKKISIINERQANLYFKKLKNITKIQVAIQKSDFGQLRGWPIVLDKETADEVLKYIRSKGLIIRFELSDSVWSKKQKIIYLPLGPYLKTSDQLKVCKIISEALNTP
jgi:hypothetical protein